MTLAIRAYEAGDRAAVHTVFYRAVREGAAKFYDAAQRAAWAPSPEPNLALADKLLDQKCWVAVDAGNGIVGFMSLRADGYLDMAFVLPEYQGHGVADALYQDLISNARDAGLSRLTVHASHLARRFFTKHGWRIDAAENHSSRGQVFERFSMSLPITEPAS